MAYTFTMPRNPNCYFATIDPENPAAAIAGTLLPEQGGASKKGRRAEVNRVGLCGVRNCGLTRAALGRYIFVDDSSEMLEQVPDDCSVHDEPIIKD